MPGRTVKRIGSRSVKNGPYRRREAKTHPAQSPFNSSPTSKIVEAGKSQECSGAGGPGTVW